LQAHQLAAQRVGQHLGDLGLADTGLALEKQRPVELQRQMDGGAQAAVGDIAAFGEQFDGGLDVIGNFGQRSLAMLEVSKTAPRGQFSVWFY
jgi:hypothetical protein